MTDTTMNAAFALARRGLLLTAACGALSLGCDAEPEPDEPFAGLALAALEDDAALTAASTASTPAPGAIPVADAPIPVPPPRCVLDGDGDGILSLWDYESALEMSPADCVASGGALLGDIAGVIVPTHGASVEPPQSLAFESPTAAAIGNVSVPAGTPIPQEVLDWVNDTGIPDREYKPDEYDCDDFARDLEQAFEGLLPGAGTFTYIACEWDEEAGNYSSAHAITDVHGGGAVAWIEPQTGQPVDLDKNGDGMVTFGLDFSGYPEPTDGDCFIAVFESAEAAQDAGLELD